MALRGLQRLKTVQIEALTQRIRTGSTIAWNSVGQAPRSPTPSHLPRSRSECQRQINFFLLGTLFIGTDLLIHRAIPITLPQRFTTGCPPQISIRTLVRLRV